MATKQVSKDVSKEDLPVIAVSVDKLKLVPRKAKRSKFDPIARAIFEAKDPKKAFIYNVPKGRDPIKHRSQVYAAMYKSLAKVDAKVKFKVSVAVLEGNQFGISASW